MSRPLERAELLSWDAVFGTVGSMLHRDLGWMALVTGFSLFIWMDIAALIAFGMFSHTVISIPMLFDRDIDFVTAMITSVRVVKRNPRVMAV